MMKISYSEEETEGREEKAPGVGQGRGAIVSEAISSAATESRERVGYGGLGTTRCIVIRDGSEGMFMA